MPDALTAAHALNAILDEIDDYLFLPGKTEFARGVRWAFAQIKSQAECGLRYQKVAREQVGGITSLREEPKCPPR